MAIINQAPLQVLVLEDNPADAELAMRELRRAGFEFEWQRVEDEAGYLAGLDESPDLIVADFHLPQFDGSRALKLRNERELDIPFIIVSGAIGEESAVECMRLGADDYLIKDRLARLGAATERALERKQLRAEREHAQQRLRHLNEVLKAILDVSQIIAREQDAQRLLESVCETLLQARGYHMIWAGRIEEGHFRVIPVASCGAGTEYLEKITVTWDESETGQGPSGRALRSRQPVVVPDIRSATDFTPWREMALEHGLAAMISMPIIYGQRRYGVICVYSDIAGSFDDEEVKLLGQLARDVGFALYSIEEQERRRQAELQVHRLSQIVEQSPVSIVMTDTEGRIEYVNPQFCKMTEYSIEEVFGKNPNIIQSGNTPDETYDDLWQTIKEGKVWQGEMQNCKKSGQLFWEMSYFTPLTNTQGEITHFVALKEDITERKAIEEELIRREMLLSQAQHLAHLGSWEVDLESNEVQWSQEMFRIFGLDPESGEPTVEEILALFQPGDREQMEQAYQRLIEDRIPYAMDGKITRPDGQERIFHVRGDIGETCHEEGRKPIKTLGTSQDVTEAREAEQALRESEEKHRTLFETMAQGVVYQDASGKFISINPAAQRILDLSLEQMHEYVEPSLRWVVVREDGSDFSLKDWPAMIALRSGQAVHNVVMGFINPDEDITHWLNVTAVPQFQPGEDRPYQVHTTFDDITDRKLREAEMEAVVAITTALRSAGSRDEMLPIIVQQIEDILKAEGVALGLYDEATDEIVFEQCGGIWEDANGVRLSEGAGLSSQIVRTGEPSISNDAQNEPGRVQRDLFGQLAAAAGIPLSTQDTTIGVLWAGRNRPFTEIDVRLLQLIAEIAASAIHRATLHEQMQNSLQQLRSLREIDRAITGSVDLNLIFGVVLDQVKTRLKVDAADILLLDPHTQWLDFARGYGFLNEARMRNFHLRLGEGIAGRVAVEQKMIREADIGASGSEFVRKDLLDQKFTAYIGVPLIAKGQVCGVLELFHCSPMPGNSEWLNFVETLAGQAAIAIDSVQLFQGLQRSNVDLTLAYDANIEAWSHALDLRDKETEGHSLRVTQATLLLARGMGMAADELVHVRRGSLLHDIGKMGVPDSILLKPGKLTDEEWVVMRKHPFFAYELLAPIVFLQNALDIPYCHHEKWDGSGYPRGLKGEQIPLAARIFAVIDVWDALRSDRPYREAWPTEKVRDLIRESSGSHFDPKVVESFLRMEDMLETEVRAIRDSVAQSNVTQNSALMLNSLDA